MNRSILIAVLIAAGAALWVGSGALSESNQPEVKKGPAEVSDLGERQQVRVLKVEAESYQRSMVLRGSTEADRKVNLRAEAAGRIKTLPFEKGAHIEKGDLLLEIDPQDYPARLREAEALREQRRIEVEAARKLAEKGYRSQTELAAAEAALQAADAAVERAEVALENLKIYAPFSGKLETRQVELGDFLDKGDGVGQLVDLDPIRVVGFANEQQIDDLSVGAEASARLLNGERLEGVIDFISSTAEPGTRTFRVELSVPNADERVPDGITAEMRLPRSTITAHRISPAFLTLADDGRVGVRAVDEESNVVFHPISIVGESREAVWVTGLPKTALVIVVGQEFVREGDPVEPFDADSLEPVFAPAAGDSTQPTS